MKLWQALLYPFSVIYRSVTTARNELYQKQVFQSSAFDIPVIVVGNLTVGGTGKTPHVAYLVELLQKAGKKPAVISRGYGRKTKGFILADSTATAGSIGDEPMTYVRQFPGLTVAVGEKRAEAIEQLLMLAPETDVILLDDAFQHRAVSGNLNLLLTDYARLYTRDYVLPSGLLRESRSGAERADAVFVTKCPAELTTQQQSELQQEIARYTRQNTPVYFTRYEYGNPVSIGKPCAVSNEILLVTGIAQPQLLVDNLKSEGYRIVQHFDFRDHHDYSEKDLRTIQTAWENSGRKARILTTSKDAVKLQRPEWETLLKKMPVYFVPIRVAFLGAESDFQQLIQATVATSSREIT